MIAFENTSYLLLSAKWLEILFKVNNGVIISYFILWNKEAKLKMFIKAFKSLLSFRRVQIKCTPVSTHFANHQLFLLLPTYSKTALALNWKSINLKLIWSLKVLKNVNKILKKYAIWSFQVTKSWFKCKRRKL